MTTDTTTTEIGALSLRRRRHDDSADVAVGNTIEEETPKAADGPAPFSEEQVDNWASLRAKMKRKAERRALNAARKDGMGNTLAFQHGASEGKPL